MEWTGYVMRMTNVFKTSVGKRERKRTFEKLGLDGRIILKCILRKCC
jgi:hypothetical protein